MNNTSRKLLVIDDDAVTRRMVSRVLTGSGYQVLQAEGGEAGLVLFHDSRPDLVLLDVMMPGMNGYETCTRLRAVAGHTLPVLMLTGLNDINSVDHAFEAGATDFITKPINWPLLSERVRYALRARDMQLELERQRQQLESAQRIARLGYFEYDLSNKTLSCSSELKSIIDLHDQRAGHFGLDDFIEMIHPDDREMMQSAFETTVRDGTPYTLDHRLTPIGGGARIVTQHGEAVRDEQGRCVGVLAAVQDITERRAAETLAQYRAYHDSATGLPNRRYFSENAHQLLASDTESNLLSAIVVLNIDRFQPIIDTLGYDLGNELLVEVGGRLEEYIGTNGLVARFDSSVFAILVRNFKHIDEITQRLSRIGNLLISPFHLDPHEIFITVSMGVAVHPLESDDIEILIKNAGVALSRALDEGGNTNRFFTAEMDTHAHKRHALESDLRHALERNELAVFYQPQINAATGMIHGMEALVRWHHPTRGLVSPLEFIPLAEETGLIIPIGEWVLETACKDCKDWLQMSPELVVGVNLSTRQLRSELPDIVRGILKRTGLPASNLDLEITESMAMQDFQITLQLLNAMRREGTRISIDDFGTGHSSLSYLRQLPVDTVKIDRAFVKDIGGSDNGVLAKTIIAMAHGLGMHCIAEGVETENHRAFLSNHGCDILQGFLFSTPLPREKFQAYLEQGHSKSQVAV